MRKAGELFGWNFTLIKVPTLSRCRTTSEESIFFSTAKFLFLFFFFAPVPVNCSRTTQFMVYDLMNKTSIVFISQDVAIQSLNQHFIIFFFYPKNDFQNTLLRVTGLERVASDTHSVIGCSDVGTAPLLAANTGFSHPVFTTGCKGSQQGVQEAQPN